MIADMIHHKARSRPVFALTMGDPAGIGPEIAIKSFRDQSFQDTVLVIGEAAVMAEAARQLGVQPDFHIIESVAGFIPGSINIIDCRQIRLDEFTPGKIQKSCGRAAFHYIEKSIAMALAGDVDGVITNPISKEALALAGIHYPGHTEIFAEKTATNDYSMLFLLKNVGVAHVTTHCSLKNAIAAITTERVVNNILLIDNAMRQLGVQNPRIAVGGLNPHAGENGLFGTEEIEYITPAIKIAQRDGVAASGPYPPDTVFMRAFKGEFDGIVSMLHDHGFVALKSMDFKHGVNITIGLPVIRTSVGHGTAFEIAGKGIAYPESLLAAHDAAVRLYENRKQQEKV